MAKAEKSTILSEGQKLRIIQESTKLKKKWNRLDRQGKLLVFEGMDIATDYKWVLSLLTEALDNKSQEGTI